MEQIQFSKEELERYSRHLIIPEFNIEGQRKLKGSSVLVIGSGGLGSPLLLYLAAAGVGRIGIVDFDTVDASNLQRQVLFGIQSVGAPKRKPPATASPPSTRTSRSRCTTPSSRAKMPANSCASTTSWRTGRTTSPRVTSSTTRACSKAKSTCTPASIGLRAKLRCSMNSCPTEPGAQLPRLVSLPPPPGLVPSCAEGGVIGVLPGILGSLQALEVIKVITGVGDTLSGRLFLFDATGFTTRTMKVRKDPRNPLNGENPTQTELIDYDQFCGIGVPAAQEREVEAIDVHELKAWRDSGKAHVLIDVREPYEYGIAEIGGDLMPLATVLESTARIPKDVPVVVQCRSGARSAKAIRQLEDAHGYTNLVNLTGGILAWQEHIDTSLARY